MSKHKLIFDALYADITEGKFARDGRLPSEGMLCRKWQVSRPTVARALRDLQLQGLIDRRAGAGTFVKAEARPVQVTMGLLVEGLGRTEILDPICAEITRAAQQRGCGVFTGGLPEGKSIDELADEWAANGVKGIFFAPLEHVPEDGPGREKLNEGIATAFEKRGICVVLVDRDLVEFPARSGCDLVGMDNFQAGCILGEHLSESGPRLAFVARPRFPSTTDLRLAGLREGMRRKFTGNAQVDFWVGDPEDAEFCEQILRSERKRSAAVAYDVIVCSNDMTAARLMQTALGLGFNVPGDFKMAGFDDAGFAALLGVPLTTVRQPCRGIGLACVDTMIGRLRHPELPPRSILLRGELVVRASTSMVA